MTQIASKSENTAVPVTDTQGTKKHAKLLWLRWAAPAVATFLICLWNAGRPSLWTDELGTWLAVDRSFSDLLKLVDKVDAVFALYYIFMHGWVSVFGDSELSLRFPSIIAMAIAAGLLCLVAERLSGYLRFDATSRLKAGVAAASIFTILPMVTRYGQEVRVYAIVIALAIGATLAFLVALDKPTFFRWFIYGFLLVLLAYAHLLAITIVVSHALVVFIYQRVNIRAWLLTAALVGAAITPLVVWSYPQRSQVEWIPTPRWLMVTLTPGELTESGIIAGILIALTLWLLLNTPAGVVPALLASWAIIPILMIFTAARITPLWNSRYVLFVVPALVLGAALTFAALPWTKLGIAVLVVGVFGLPIQLDLRRGDGHNGMDGRAAAAIIASHMRDTDGIVYVRDEVWVGRGTVAYYLPQRSPQDVLAVGTPASNNDFSPEECLDPAPCVGNTPRLWILRWGSYEADPLQYVEEPKRTLLADHYTETQVWEIDGLTLALYDRRPIPTA